MSLLNQLSQIGLRTWHRPWPGEDACSGRGWRSVVALIIGSRAFLNQPTRETLYIGLSGEDITQISLVLAEANIDFASGADGTRSPCLPV
jgi:flagellar M-ring protein FliF